MCGGYQPARRADPISGKQDDPNLKYRYAYYLIPMPPSPAASRVARHASGSAKVSVTLQAVLMFGLLRSRKTANSETNIGQNNSLTVMILNLAPEKDCHQDTLSSLNFANRTKKIEVREIENEPVFKGCTRAVPALTGTSIQRQPLRPLATSSHDSAIHSLNFSNNQGDRQAKAFSVYSDRARLCQATRTEAVRHSPLKRPCDQFPSSSRPTKRSSPDCVLLKPQTAVSKEVIEKIIEDKVTDILATRALEKPSMAPQPDISEKVQKRLEMLEKKINGKDDGREQGLSFLLMAKQHTVRGEDLSALRMYTLAKDHFPDNRKLDLKIERLREKTHQRKPEKRQSEFVVETAGSDHTEDKNPVYSDCETYNTPLLAHRPSKTITRPKKNNSGVHGGQVNAQLTTKSSTLDTIMNTPKATKEDSNYETDVYDEDNGYESDAGFHYKATAKEKRPRFKSKHDDVDSPRTKRLLDVVNARDISQIRRLRGVGAKKAEMIVEALGGADEDESKEIVVQSLSELGRLKGVGPKTVESMRAGLQMV